MWPHAIRIWSSGNCRAYWVKRWGFCKGTIFHFENQSMLYRNHNMLINYDKYILNVAIYLLDIYVPELHAHIELLSGRHVSSKTVSKDKCYLKAIEHHHHFLLHFRNKQIFVKFWKITATWKKNLITFLTRRADTYSGGYVYICTSALFADVIAPNDAKTSTDMVINIKWDMFPSRAPFY